MPTHDANPSAPLANAAPKSRSNTPDAVKRHASPSGSSSDSAILVSNNNSSEEPQNKHKSHLSTEEPFQEDGKAFYDELAREDKAEEEEFLDIVRRDAEEIKAARQVIKDARRLANTKATHLHRSVCPESADVEPPLSFHHQVWAREQQQMAKLAASHQGAPAMAQEPQLSDTTRDVDLSEVSSDSDSETESEDSDAEALPEATPQPLGQQCHPHHVHFNQRVESHSPPPSISVQAIPPSSVRRQSYRITPEVPSEAEARQTYRPASRDKNRSRALPTQFLKAIRTRPWAYQSLWRISMLLQGTRLPSDISRVVVVLDQDVELSYDEFERAYGRYIEELFKVQPSTAQLFQKHFAKISALYTPDLWPALRVYDIRVRSAHLGDTSTDLVHLDKRLLGTILIEEADDALHHFHLGPDHREGAARISTTTSPTVVRSGDDLVDLADFLDEIYNGAGKFAEDFYTAGVTSPESFAEAALLEAQAIDELVDVVRDASEMSPYLGIMLKKGLKRRFGGAATSGSMTRQRRKRGL